MSKSRHGLVNWLVYGFILVTALHSALLYAHHATAPDIHQRINIGSTRRGDRDDGDHTSDEQTRSRKRSLARSIHDDIVAQVKRDLGIPTSNRVLDLPALPVDNSAPYPVTFAKETISPLSWDWLRSKFQRQRCRHPRRSWRNSPNRGNPFPGENESV
ncbi:MAG: hypothetical protein U0V48_18250 [Anaerolineales bacterium]